MLVTGWRLNNAATVLAMLISYAMHMGDVYMAYHKCCLHVRATFLARLHEVHRAIAVTTVVHVPVRVRVTLALKFSRSPYLDNHSSESIHTWTIDTL